MPVIGCRDLVARRPFPVVAELLDVRHGTELQRGHTAFETNRGPRLVTNTGRLSRISDQLVVEG